ncbi:GNAT family N-acetyltransferase [Radicibacter daui]|uniref:GNAT family N-acetyltransferase n=1 Tax=Radicibacter daui TaxID=3064829 RepID=UPI00404693FB
MIADPVILDNPDPALRDAIRDPLVAFNEAQIGKRTDMGLLAIPLTETETGKVIGGLWGRTGFAQLFTELLFVPESLRGQHVGEKLMAMAEEEARRRGCVGAWVDTFSFQALGFYQKLGYSIFGQIEDYPPGHQRYFLSKKL